MNQEGEGLIFRDEGVEPPAFRKLLASVKDEKISSLTLFRQPIPVNSVIKFLKLNKAYDDLFHLGIVINGKYVLDKQAVLHFERSGIPKDSETQVVPVTKELTIGELIGNTKQAMGKKRYTMYDSRRENCQKFMLEVLKANGLSSASATQFIEQDIEKIFAGLPKYADVLSNLFTDFQAFLDRQIQGEGKEEFKYNFCLPRTNILL